MNQTPSPWSRREIRQVLAVGIAPACAVAVVALAATPIVGNEVLFLVVAALPLAYGTLLLFVLPALSILRRLHHEAFLAFVCTVAGSTFLPWAAFFGIYLLTAPEIDHPPYLFVASGLGAMTAAAAITAAATWLLTFRSTNAA